MGIVVGGEDTFSAIGEKKKTISIETVSPTESEDSIPKFLSVLPHVATQVIGHILFNCWHS